MPNPTSSEFDQYLGTTAGVPFQKQGWAQRHHFPARQSYMSVQSSNLHGVTSAGGAENGHAHTASETTIEAKPTSPAHDFASPRLRQSRPGRVIFRHTVNSIPTIQLSLLPTPAVYITTTATRFTENIRHHRQYHRHRYNSFATVTRIHHTTIARHQHQYRHHTRST